MKKTQLNTLDKKPTFPLSPDVQGADKEPSGCEYKLRAPEPIVVHIEGVGDVSGWSNPGADCTTWEIVNGIDVLGPDFERYNEHNERFVCDWDDNFKDTGKWWIVAHREVLEDFGFGPDETSDESILKLFGNIHVGNTLGIERFTKDGVQYTDDEVWTLIKTRARELLAEHPMDPLLVEALKSEAANRRGSSRMANGVQVGPRFAVWSSSPRELLVEAIEANGLEDVFDTIVSVDDVENHKPHPEGLFKALKAMDVASGYLGEGEDYSDEKPLNMNGVWMLGDSPNDIKGGKAAGTSTLWVEHPLQAHSALAKRQAALEAAARQSIDEAIGVSEELRPTASVRTFDPREAGIYGKVAAGQVPFEDIIKLTTDNTSYVRFLMDKGLRANLYREEKVYKALVAQGLIDQAPGLKNVFSKRGEVQYGEPIKRAPLSSREVKDEIQKIRDQIDAQYIGLGY